MFDGCYAHIISRSIRKMKIFKDPDDFGELARLLEQTKRQAGYKIYHYSFLHTHFHLAVMIPDIGEFSGAMRHVKSRYCRAFHTKYRLSGPIWRERYRGLLIEHEGYLRTCGRYIENNPVKAGLATKATDWKYSSSRHYAGDGHDALIDPYEEDGSTNPAAEPDTSEEEFFENGSVIGSPFFRWQFYKKRK